MSKKQETVAEIVREMRGGLDMSWHEINREWARSLPDRIEATAKREKAEVEALALSVGGMVEASRHTQVGDMAAMREALSSLRSQLYEVAASMRALTARSDARERGVHYTEVQNIAAQIENIADKGGVV